MFLISLAYMLFLRTTTLVDALQIKRDYFCPLSHFLWPNSFTLKIVSEELSRYDYFFSILSGSQFFLQALQLFQCFLWSFLEYPHPLLFDLS